MLPADSKRPAVFGDERLRDLLAGSGLHPLFQARPQGAGLTLEWAGGCDAVVVEVPGARRGARERGGRAREALGAARALIPTARAALEARRVEGILRRGGMAVRRVGCGDRSRRHHVGVGARRPRLAREWLVVGLTGERPDSVVERALSGAAGGPLSLQEARGLPSGVLLCEARSTAGEPFIVRVAGAAAAGELRATAETLCLLCESGPPPPVRERVAWPVEYGECGPAGYTLERKITGDHPRRMTTRLWDQALEFLTALHGAPSAANADATASASIAADLRALIAHARPEARPTLDRLGRELPRRLDPVPLGWGHGDFWPANLLVRGGDLVGVIDWDAADPRGLPALDLLHLTALSDPRMRRFAHGRRCTEGLWPLARRGGDARLQAYCRATGTPSEPEVLEALVTAYWLNRVARDLRTFADRGERPAWLEANLHEPLAHLAGAA